MKQEGRGGATPHLRRKPLIEKLLKERKERGGRFYGENGKTKGNEGPVLSFIRDLHSGTIRLGGGM